MRRPICFLFVVAPLSCGVERADEPPPLMEMLVDGEPFVVDLQTDLDAVSYAFAWDDNGTSPKKLDPNWELVVHARDTRGRRFSVSTLRKLGVGPKTLGRAYLPRQNQPWMAMIWNELSGAVRELRPRDGETLNIIDTATGGRVRMSFERIEMLDDCGSSLILTNGTIDLDLVTTELLPPVPQLADYGLPEHTIEGGAGFSIGGQQFYDYAPETAPWTLPDGTPVIDLYMIDWCSDFRYAVSVTVAQPLQPGIADLEEGGIFWFIDLKETPFDFSDDDMWLGVSGTVETRPFDGDGLLSGRILEPIEAHLAWLDPGTSDIVFDHSDVVTIESGQYDFWIGGEY